MSRTIEIMRIDSIVCVTFIFCKPDLVTIRILLDLHAINIILFKYTYDYNRLYYVLSPEDRHPIKDLYGKWLHCLLKFVYTEDTMSQH